MKKVFIKGVDILIYMIRPLSFFIPRFIFIFLLNLSSIIPTSIGVLLRYILIKMIIVDSGSNIYIGRFVTIKNFDKIKVGNNVSIHECCYIDAFGGLEIGNDVSIAHNSSLISFEHGFENVDKAIKYNSIIPIPIKIASDVWIGCGVRILAGSDISSRSVMAAGSVVKGKLLSNKIYAGVPAKPKKSI